MSRPPSDEHLPAAMPTAAPVPDPAARAPRVERRPWLRWVLFGLTVVSVGYIGWLWEGGGQVWAERGILASFREFARPPSWISALPYTFSVLAILGSHEMGHYLACRYYGIPATPPYFIPGFVPFGTFGAVIRIRGVIPHRKALFDIAAAGPLAGLVVAVPILAVGILNAVPAGPHRETSGDLGFGDSLLSNGMWRALHGAEGDHVVVGAVYIAAWFGLLVTSMNLFPVGQLDGGHLFYAVSRRLHRVVSWATLFVLSSFVLVSTIVRREPSVYTVWCIVLLVLRDRHPRLRDEHTPLGTARKILFVVLVIVFVVTFIPIPFLLYD